MEQSVDNALAYYQKTNGTAYAVAESLNDVSGTYSDRSITYNGSLANLDIDSILRSKQEHINDIYQLADYYVDAEELVGSAVKKIYVPFSLSDGWYLTGGNEKTRSKYYEYFKRIHLNEKLESWFYQYFLFANVYMSILDDGDVVTMPPHLCRITNVLINGNPLVEYNARSVKQDFKKRGQKSLKKFIDDDNLDVRVAGLPREVAEALSKNTEYVQLDPKNTFLWQGYKPEWTRYAMPMIVQCLKPLAKKEIISAYENALLALAASSFLHITVGTPKESKVVPDVPILTAVQNLAKSAMKAGGGILTTNDCVNAKFIQVDVDHMFDKNKYENVDESILGALGISSSVTSGADSQVSFGSSQVSAKLVSLRITAARKSFCDLMNRIIRAVNGSPYGLPRSTSEKLPAFMMPVSDLTKVAAFQEACLKLWESGNLSRKTLMEGYNIDLDMEYDRKKQEQQNGYDEVFTKPGASVQKEDKEETDGEATRGRPTLSDDERESDPGNSVTGRAPKPSNAEGSEAQEE